MKKKMILVVTLCRRYHELRKNLSASLTLAKSELGYQPEVVLVWARPEISRLWLIQELLAEGKVKHVVGRPALAGERDAGSTTFPESHNIRLGLEWARENLPRSYAVVQAADVSPCGGTYAFIDRHFSEGQKAVVFHWGNGCANSDVWHTNFFAASLDEAYWPPLSPPDSPDTLESQYGKFLAATRPESVFVWHNSGEKRFLHRHESEGLAPFPELPQRLSGGVHLFIKGHKTLWARAIERLRSSRVYLLVSKAWKKGVSLWQK